MEKRQRDADQIGKKWGMEGSIGKDSEGKDMVDNTQVGKRWEDRGIEEGMKDLGKLDELDDAVILVVKQQKKLVVEMEQKRKKLKRSWALRRLELGEVIVVEALEERSSK